jgi:hypothetical protein
MAEKRKSRQLPTTGGEQSGQGIQGETSPSIPHPARNFKSQHSSLEVLQVLPAPDGVFVEFKEPDGSIVASKVPFLALTRRTYRNQVSYSLEPMIADDLGYSLADEFSNFHQLRDIRS